jgi:hypothetical protein
MPTGWNTLFFSVFSGWPIPPMIIQPSQVEVQNDQDNAKTVLFWAILVIYLNGGIAAYLPDAMSPARLAET